jgi:hypothetical protein
MIQTTRNFQRQLHERVSVTSDESQFVIWLIISNGMKQGEYELPFESLSQMEEKEHEIMTGLAMRHFVLVGTEEAEYDHP